MEIVERLSVLFPDISYRPGKRFSWSPETSEIFYDNGKPTASCTWSLLHETGHALLEHNCYDADLELIRLEIAAWEKAKEIATELGIAIDENHIQDCLDTYRDWVYQRSVCPRCNNKSLQLEDIVHYQCFNCHLVWKVTPSRFCRTYRATQKATKKPSAVFYATDGTLTT
jgi:hypothetical protein